jgi:hypothetical protein
MIPGLLFSHPFLRSNFSPARNGSQNHPLADIHGEAVDKLAGEIVALITTLKTLFLGARPNETKHAI